VFAPVVPTNVPRKATFLSLMHNGWPTQRHCWFGYGSNYALRISQNYFQEVRGNNNMEGTNRRLMFHGMCLFVLGLLTGFAEQHFANVRMGLAAHLEGLMNGTFLVVLGAIWPHVRLSLPTTTIAYWTVLYGTYVNWLITILAAVFGTAALSPITGAGHSGQPWQEGFVTIGFMSVGITIVTSSVLVLWGLRRKVSP
jgi:hydroxylaminobenzene mutase